MEEIRVLMIPFGHESVRLHNEGAGLITKLLFGDQQKPVQISNIAASRQHTDT
jgi:hypothetical protein